MNVVVTGGGTVAPIDDVRQITNVSSGRFAAAISEACLERGAAVWHIHTPQAQLPFIRSARFDLTTSEMGSEHARLDRLRRQWQAVRRSSFTWSRCPRQPWRITPRISKKRRARHPADRCGLPCDGCLRL